MIEAKQKILLGLLFLALGIWAFWGVALLQPTSYDDAYYLARAPQESFGSYLVALATEPVLNLWHPLTVASHDVLVFFFGEKHLAHHFANSALHLIAGALFYFWLRTFDWSRALCLSLSLVWVVHPLAVEPTSWISGRKELLLAVFTFAALLLNRAPKLTLALPLVVFLAVMSKPTAVILPGVLLLDEWFRPPGNGPSLKRMGLKLLALFPVTFLILFVTLKFQNEGTQNVVDERDFLLRASQAGWAFSQYFIHSFFPKGLHVSYGMPEATSLAFSLFCLLIFFGVAVLCCLPKVSPGVQIGAGIFILFLLPTIGFVRAGNDLITDRYAYLPLAGLIVILGGLLPKKNPQYLPKAFALLVVLLAFLSIQQRQHWRSSEALFNRVLNIEPDHAYALAQIGTLALEEGRNTEGVKYLERAITLEPLLALAHHSLGDYRESQREFSEAKEHYLVVEKSWGAQAWVKVHLSLLSWNLGQRDEAYSYLKEAKLLSKDPTEFQEICELELRLKN